MASNAKPLWSLLPDGALKIQLLSEIASLVHMGVPELSALWGPASAPKSKQQTYRDPVQQSQSNMGYRANARKRPGRALPTSRADHAARILLANTGLWESLGSEDQSMLCELPAPHGSVFTWLERQMHEHGPLPWEALRLEMLGQPDIEWALQAMSNAALVHDPAEDAALELRDLLNRLLIERLKDQETRAIEDSKHDPAALTRYRELVARRMQMEKNQSDAIIQG
jgi:DNA primase